jgi:hypothetical protein
MDYYYEETVEMRNSKTRTALRMMLATITPIFLILGLYYIIFLYWWTPVEQSVVPLFIKGGVFIAIGLAAWFLRYRLVYDFDYILVNGEIKIVKILSKRTRKLFADVKGLQIGKIGRYNSEDYKALVANPKIKPVFASPNKPEEWKSGYYISYQGVNGTCLLVLECKGEFIATLLKYGNRSVLEKGLTYHDLLG